MRYEFFSEEIKPCLIMEYLPLGNLESQHQTSPIAVEEYMAVLCQGLQALEYLHSEQVAHRDIKPTNILLRSRRPFHIKLADFGLSTNASILQTQCGTCLYRAPGIWSGSRYTAAVDIWSLGLVVYQYAYGLPSYRGIAVEGTFDAWSWNDCIVRAVNNRYPDKLINFLSSSMLKRAYSERRIASECLQQVHSLFPSVLPNHEAEVASTRACQRVEEQGNLEARSTVRPSSSHANASIDPRTHRDLRSPSAHSTPGIEIVEQRPTLRMAVDRVLSNNQEFASNSTAERADNTGSLKLQRHNVPKSELSLHAQHVVPPHIFGVDSLTQPGYHQMTVNGKQVTMRKADFWLNATQILALTGKSVPQCEEIMSHFRARSAAEMLEFVDTFDHPSYWVSYKVGRLLCDVLKLRETLSPLLQFGDASTVASER